MLGVMSQEYARSSCRTRAAEKGDKMKLSEATNRVIDLADKVRAYYEREMPKWHPKYPLAYPGEEDPPPPPEEKELREFLLSLPEDMIRQLILIMHLGREDFGADALATQYEELKGTYGDSEQTASHLASWAPLADQLLDGLEELRKHQIDVDKLPLEKVPVPKR
jgi:hypothetical protein